MFSFHKPKIYRSLNGCCICRAKSSSSRFTDSKRYEMDFQKCFMINERRSGEICNACVLLVKRWKKLPIGSNRNWHHVVDARAGPGTKSIMKLKSRGGGPKEETLPHIIRRKKHKHRRQLRSKPPQSPGGLSDDVIMGEDFHSDDSNNSLSGASDYDDDDKDTRSSKSRRRVRKPVRCSSFLDLTYWKKTQVCCGIIFKGPNNEVLVDPKLLHACRSCKAPSQNSDSCSSTESVVGDLMDSHETSPQPPVLPHCEEDSRDSLAFDDSNIQVGNTPNIQDGDNEHYEEDCFSSEESSTVLRMDEDSFDILAPLPDQTNSLSSSSTGVMSTSVLDLSLPKLNNSQSALGPGQPRCIALQV